MTSPDPGPGGSGHDDDGALRRYNEALARNRAGFAEALTYVQQQRNEEAMLTVSNPFRGDSGSDISDNRSDVSGARTPASRGELPPMRDPIAPARSYLSPAQPHLGEASQHASTENVPATGDGNNAQEDWRTKYRPQPEAELDVVKIVRDVSALHPGNARGAELNPADISKQLIKTAAPDPSRVAKVLQERQDAQAAREQRAASQEREGGLSH
jgi:hypothetical protein